MPAVLGYVIGAVPVSPFATPGSTPFLGGGFLTGCDALYQNQLYFLGVLDRSYPKEYVVGLQAKPNGGYELFQAAAKVAERTSIAVNRLECGAFLMTAEGGAYSRGEVEFYRDVSTDGAINMLAGSVVSTPFGRDFLLLEDATFGAADLGPVAAAVQAVAMGFEYNVPGQVVTRGGEVLPGEISVITKVLSYPVAVDRFMRVRQIVPTTGGRDADLDGLGDDLSIPRNNNEPDSEYRQRIFETPDTVCLNAIKRGIDKLLQARDPTFGSCLREVGRPLLPGVFFDAGASGDTPQDPARNFAFDMDPALRPEDRFKLLLDRVEFRGFLLVGVPSVIDGDFGMAYDGSSADLFPLPNAYDTTAENALSAAYDGFTRLASSFYKSLSDMVAVKLAAGVGFDLYIEDIGCF